MPLRSLQEIFAFSYVSCAAAGMIAKAKAAIANIFFITLKLFFISHFYIFLIQAEDRILSATASETTATGTASTAASAATAGATSTEAAATTAAAGTAAAEAA